MLSVPSRCEFYVTVSIYPQYIVSSMLISIIFTVKKIQRGILFTEIVLRLLVIGLYSQKFIFFEMAIFRFWLSFYFDYYLTCSGQE